MAIVVFEDEHVDRLQPITLSRAAYTISCGSFRLVDWLRLLSDDVRGIVQPHLQHLQEFDYPDLSRALKADGDRILFVNARVVPSAASFETLRHCLQQPHSGVIRSNREIAAVLLTPATDAQIDSLTPQTTQQFFAGIGIDQFRSLDQSLSLFHYPHDIVRHNTQILTANLEYRLGTGDYREVADGIFAAGQVTIGDHVVIERTGGPILLEDGVSIGPFCLIRGPAYIGRNAKVIEHAAIKEDVAIGHTTKIGGEVEASVIEAYTNKQHHGFLGHSYLGSWINLGAGTCNSDLKNTYGKVNMEYRLGKVSTDMQFIGCMMGDYAKSAINTGIFTGKVIGVCSMLYGFVTTNVPSFVNYARLFGQVTELPPDVMIATQRRMFHRRNVEQRPCDAQLIRDMYEMTYTDRQLAGPPLSL